MPIYASRFVKKFPKVNIPSKNFGMTDSPSNIRRLIQFTFRVCRPLKVTDIEEI